MAARTAISAPYNFNTNALNGGLFAPASGFSGTTAPGVPASTTPVTNSNAWAVMVVITGGTMTAVVINGVTVGAGAGTYWLPAGQAISLTYTVAPTWTWTASGVDAAGAGGANFGAGWNGAATGVQFVNNGLVMLWYYNGGTACNAYALVGSKAGGQVPAYTDDQATLLSPGTGWLGPWNAAQYNQQDASQFAGGSGGASPGGIIGAGGVGLMCVDFSAVNSLVVRAMQFVPA